MEQMTSSAGPAQVSALEYPHEADIGPESQLMNIF